MQEITLENLGTILKKIRKEKGFTQKEVAEGIQVNQSLISGWENGTYSPTFLNIYKLCQFFGMTVDEILGIDKKQYVTLVVNRDMIEKLFSTFGEFEDGLAFILPSQETKLHQTWEEIKQIIRFVFYSARKNGEEKNTLTSSSPAHDSE